VLDCGDHKFVVKSLRFQPARKMILVVRETHDTPETVAHRLERAGGINRLGKQTIAPWGAGTASRGLAEQFEDRDEHALCCASA